MNKVTLEVALKSLGEVGSTILFVALGIALIELLLWLVFGKLLKHKLALPIMLIAPAAVGLLLLVVYPLVYEIRLAFSNMSLRSFKNPKFGLAYAASHLVRIFTQPILKQVGFWPLLFRTFLWTFIQVSFHVAGGMFLATLLNQKMRLKGFYRTILVLPWAVPQIIATLAWRCEFHYDYGFINIMLKDIGFQAIQWKQNGFWNFVAVNIVNIWLGVPFMMVTLLGGLQSIDASYYEAAHMDGASGWMKFWNITIPLVKPVLTPSVVYGIIWTFNNFNVPYFINEMELESSDILVTALFRAAFEYNVFGFAAMFAIVVFLILLGLTILYMRVSNFKPNVKRVREFAKEAA
jgi:arabinogalactan oligomer/maltooligosaccharide transport system permease protein